MQVMCTDATLVQIHVHKARLHMQGNSVHVEVYMAIKATDTAALKRWHLLEPTLHPAQSP